MNLLVAELRGIKNANAQKNKRSKLRGIKPKRLNKVQRQHLKHDKSKMKLKVLSIFAATILAIVHLQAQNVSTYAGAGGVGYINGHAALAKFSGLEQMTYDKNGNLLVCDAPNHCIRRIDAKGNVSTFAGTGAPGFVDGSIAVAQFNNPLGIAVDNQNNVYVSDNLNFVIRKIDTQGNVTTYAGNGEQGYEDGDGITAKFGYLNYMCFDDAQNLYVADPNNNVIRKIDAQQNVTTFVGSGKAALIDGKGTFADLSFPIAIAYDKYNHVFYISDQGNSAIRKALPDGTLSTYAGTGIIGHVDGEALSAKFYFPKGLTTDQNGNIYVAGRFDYTVRKIDTYGRVSTVAGIPHVSGNSNGESTTAKFGKPIEVVISPDGNLLVSDWINSTIRKIELPVTASTGIVYKNEIETKVMPNPVTTSAIIKINGTIGKEPISFVMYDVTGKEVNVKNTISGLQIIVERGDLSSGTYFFKLVQNSKVIGMDKLIIE